MFLPDLLRQDGAGALLDHLLVPALHRAVALAEVDHVPPAVAEDLHLDVAGLLDELLDVDRAVAEGRLGLRPRLVAGCSRSEMSLCATRMPRPPPPATALIRTG